MTEQKPITVTITRVLAAPIELVWRAWTDPAQVVRWMKCEPGVAVTYTGWQPAVGARFTSTMCKPGAWENRGSGEFLAVEPPRLLAYRMDANPAIGAPAMTVRIELESTAGGTRLTLSHSGIPSDMMRGIIEAGWTGSLQMLAERLAKQ
ncbi:MAG TPA: SRPBCC domain-containing protein [Planctomycetota bacterium]|nr:SRPBCC domain-containing protein [Planctomycetota bacterium]